jgi:hypothetical protein
MIELFACTKPDGTPYAEGIAELQQAGENREHDVLTSQLLVPMWLVQSTAKTLVRRACRRRSPGIFR